MLDDKVMHGKHAYVTCMARNLPNASTVFSSCLLPTTSFCVCNYEFCCTDKKGLTADASYRRLEWIEGKILKEDRKSLVFAYHGKFDKGTAPTQVQFIAYALLYPFLPYVCVSSSRTHKLS